MNIEPRLFLIKGDDQTLLTEARMRLLEDVLPKENTMSAVEEIDATETSVHSIVDACQTPSLFGDLRVIIVQNIGSLRAADADLLIEAIAEPLDTTVLICVAGGGQVSKRLVETIRKSGKVIDTAVPTGKARSGWFNEQLSDLPVKFASDAKQALLAHLGEDVSRVFAIAEALATAYGLDTTVNLEQIQMFLGEAGNVAPWDLTDAIDRGDIESSLIQLHRMMHAGERHSLVILAILYRHFRAMLTLAGDPPANEHEAAARLGMAPFPAKKAMKQSELLGFEAIGSAINYLSDADDAVRGGSGLDDEAVMEILVARLARISRPAPKSNKSTKTGMANARAALH